jgi:hypothetical protein
MDWNGFFDQMLGISEMQEMIEGEAAFKGHI